MSKRPGFRVKKTIFRLRFEDEEDFEGLEIEAKSLPLGEFFELQKLQQKAATDGDAAEQVIERLSAVLMGWNLEDEDTEQPVPCTFEGLKSLEMGFVMKILWAWMEAVASVPNSSKSSSNDGGTSQELSIPMEVS